MLLILGGKRQGHTKIRPFDAELRIVKPHTHIRRWAIEVVALVAEERVVLKHYEAVGKATRDEELPTVFGAKRNRHMLTEGRRAFADIDGDIPDRPFDYAD